MFYRFAKLVLILLVRVKYRFVVLGLQSEPLNGSLIVAANHHSAWDPIFVGLALKRNLRFMAKVELFQYPGLRQIVTWLGAFPVNRGKGDSRAIRSALSILKNGEALAMFPEGTRVKEGDASEAQSGIALLAAKTDSPVLPVRVVRSGNKVEVRIGQPIMFSLEPDKQKPDKADLHEFSQQVMAKIRNL